MGILVRRFMRKNPETGESEARGLEVDIRLRLPDGENVRDRSKSEYPEETDPQNAPLTRRWAKERELELLREWKRSQAKLQEGDPAVKEFGPDFVEKYLKANKQKPSYISSVEDTLRLHIYPIVGGKRLSQIRKPDIQAIKLHLKSHSQKTVRNVLSVLSMLLKTAEDWEVIREVPVKIKSPKAVKPEMEYYEFEDYDRLVQAAKELEPRTYLMVLLGGEAGLRAGEMIALEWKDIDSRRGYVTVRRSEWRGQVTAPKGGRSRRVKLTDELRDALASIRHLRGKRVLWSQRDPKVTKSALDYWMQTATKAAGLEERTGVHILRHTFCSHLAIQGAPAMAIKEAAGHADLATTQRYMHLSPKDVDRAIDLLNQRKTSKVRGDRLETAP